jgi:hypothetical protein
MEKPILEDSIREKEILVDGIDYSLYLTNFMSCITELGMMYSKALSLVTELYDTGRIPELMFKNFLLLSPKINKFHERCRENHETLCQIQEKVFISKEYIEKRNERAWQKVEGLFLIKNEGKGF